MREIEMQPQKARRDRLTGLGLRALDQIDAIDRRARIEFSRRLAELEQVPQINPDSSAP
jgi:hypothetical protein